MWNTADSPDPPPKCLGLAHLCSPGRSCALGPQPAWHLPSHRPLVPGLHAHPTLPPQKECLQPARRSRCAACELSLAPRCCSELAIFLSLRPATGAHCPPSFSPRRSIENGGVNALQRRGTLISKLGVPRGVIPRVALAFGVPPTDRRRGLHIEGGVSQFVNFLSSRNLCASPFGRAVGTP